MPGIEPRFLTSLSRAAVSPLVHPPKRGTYDRAPHIGADRGGPRKVVCTVGCVGARLR